LVTPSRYVLLLLLGALRCGAYVAWIKRYIFFHDKRHPAEMGGPEVARFLTSLAVESKIAASTQNQALNALLFLYRIVLRAGASVAR
jgi:hypothetical protein